VHDNVQTESSKVKYNVYEKHKSKESKHPAPLSKHSNVVHHTVAMTEGCSIESEGEEGEVGEVGGERRREKERERERIEC
jgi:hypothetical protein